ncbi:MAG: hypothetical protein O3A06_11405, partial [Proteobacteria bacterium]|nr:hypothetical protein [Pseudomonadota bacterium]
TFTHKDLQAIYPSIYPLDFLKSQKSLPQSTTGTARALGALQAQHGSLRWFPGSMAAGPTKGGIR